MRKNPILLFTLIIVALTLAAVAYIQSAHFAGVLKSIAIRSLPENLGIQGDFDHLQVKLFPPGVAIVGPQLAATGANPAGIPVGSQVKADRLELIFRPFQIISGRVRVHEVRIVRGDVRTELKSLPETRRKKTDRLSWEELFQIRADRLELENTHVDLGLPDQGLRMEFNARKIELEKLTQAGRSFYELFLYMDTLKAQVPSGWQYPDQVDSLKTSLELDQDGIQLKDLELIRDGTQLRANGTIQGDLLSGKSLKSDLKLKLSADLQRMLEFLTKRSGKESKQASSTEKELPSGHVNFEGQVKMDLDRPHETLQASGSIEGENVAYVGYQFDRVQVEGAYAAKAQGNSFRVNRAVFEGALIPKRGGFQAGSGGRVELGEFEVNLEAPKPVQTTLKLKDAHVLWLGAIIQEDLYGLDGRISGDASVVFTPPTEKESFQVAADLDWKVDAFQIDNQRQKVTKPLHRILVIPSFNINGKISVKKDEVAFLDTVASMKATRLLVGGRIRFGEKTQYELQAGGPIDLSELTSIADNPIRGAGILGVHVTGPADKVFLDFDGDIRDLQYLRMHFGDYRGRISWEDAPSILHFRNLDCNRSRTTYKLNGQMNLGKENEDMDLRVSVPGGNINDFVSIFDELVAGFWWFPRSVSGAMNGEMRIHGGIALDEMKVDAKVEGTGWDFYTERAQKVNLVGGYDRGKYYLSDFNVRKKTGAVQGKISYDAKQVMSWDVHSESFTVTDFDHVARLELPIRGKIIGHSKGQGPSGRIESRTEVQVLDTVIRGKRFAPSSLVIQAKNGVAEVEGVVAGGQGKLSMRYALDDGMSSSLQLEAKELDFTPAVLLLNPTLIQDPGLQGTMTGSFDLRFATGRAETGSGSGSLQEYRLAREGTQFTLEKPVSVRIDQGSFLIPEASIVGPNGKVTLSVRSERGKLSGEIGGRADLSALEFITPVVEQARGYAQLRYDVGGTLKKPTLVGRARVREGLVKTPSLETPFENIDGRFDLSADAVLKAVEVSADLAGGRILTEGSIEFFLDRFPKVALEASLSGNRLKVYPFQIAKVRGKLTAKGESLPYLVSGKILVDSAISREKIASARGPGLRSAQYTPPPRMNRASDFPLFKLDIAVSAPGNVIVQNELLDVEAKGDLRIVNTLDNPRPLGEAQAVQGKVLFKDRAFVIQSGKMEFDGTTSINPRFEVMAITEIANRKIQMVASGRLDPGPRIEFSSNPPMPENEILSLLALGMTNEDARRMRVTDRSAYQQGEAASLVLHSLDFNREVQNKTGFQIGVDEAVDAQTGQSIFRRSSESDVNTAAPKIVIRRRFGERVDVNVGSTVGVGTSVQREVNAEVKVTRGFSVLGVWDTFEGINNNEPRRSSYGVDLKVQKRFK